MNKPTLKHSKFIELHELQVLKLRYNEGFQCLYQRFRNVVNMQFGMEETLLSKSTGKGRL